MFHIPFESIQINGAPFNIVDNLLQLSFRAGGRTVTLSDGPSGGEMLISRQKLLELQQALRSTENQILRIIIVNSGGSKDNFEDGTSEFQLSGNLKSVSNIKRSSTRSLKSLLAAISQETLSLLNNPVLEPGQLVPVITPPKPDPSPSPSPQPAPSPRPSDGGDGGGGNSRTFLLSVNSANSELTFGGTATGQIRLTGPAGSTSTFTREGLTQTTSITPLNTYTIILGTASNDLDGSTYTSGIKVAGSTTGDLIQGSLQADSIAAGDGNDSIAGGDGADTITGGDGADTITGGIGNDSIIGNQGDDSILAGDGNDIVVSGQGNDLIEGGDGDDALYGGSTGDDTIIGGAGADLILGDTDVDSLFGNDSNDIFFYIDEAQLVASSSLVDSAIDGAANTDRISVANGLTIANTVSFANATSIEELYVTGTAASNIAIDVTAQTAGINTINIATATANSIVDVSEFTAGVNITGGTANDTLTGGTAADTITGGAGNDVINAGAGTNSITDAGQGADAITHNVGTSTVAISVTGASTVTLDASVAGATASAANGIAATVNASGGAAVSTAAVVLRKADGTDSARVFFTGGQGADSISGGANADTLTGGDGADVVTGNNGADVMTGGAGSDRFVQADNNSVVSGAAWTNLAVGIIGNTSTIAFGTEIDTITDFDSLVDRLDADAPGAINAFNMTASAAVSFGNFFVRGDYFGTTFTVSNTTGADILFYVSTSANQTVAANLGTTSIVLVGGAANFNAATVII